MKTLRFLLTACIFLFLSCQTKTSCKLTESEKTAIEQEINTIVRNFMNAETLSYETHTGLRANHPGYLMGGEGKIIHRSYTGYQSATKQAFSGISKFTEMNITELYVYALSNYAATCCTEFKSKILTTTGDTLINNGCWTMVFKKFDSEWKIIHENGTHLGE